MSKREHRVMVTVWGLIILAVVALGFSIGSIAFGASPSASYTYRAPITLTMSGASLPQGSAVCVPYDPAPLISLGYVGVTSGTLDDVRFDDLTLTDRWVGNQDGCLWARTGAGIADGQSEVWNLYTGHPTDTRTPLAFLNKASDSIDVPDNASLDLDATWWVEMSGLNVTSIPASTVSIDHGGNYSLGIDPSGYPFVGGQFMTDTPATATKTYTSISGSYNKAGGTDWDTYTGSGCTTSTRGACWNPSDGKFTTEGINAVTTESIYGAYLDSWGIPADATIDCVYFDVTYKITTGNASSNVQIIAEKASGEGSFGTATGLTSTTFTTLQSGCGASRTPADLNATRYFWFYPYNASGSAVDFSIDGLVFYVDYTYPADSGLVTVTASQTVTPGTPVDLAGEYDGSTLRLYINGSLDSWGSQSGDPITSSDTVSIIGVASAITSLESINIAVSSASADVLDLQFFADAVSLTDAGDSGDGWTWEYSVSDQSAQANDAVWTLTAPQTGLTVSLGPLSSTVGLPDLLVSDTYADSVGNTPDINTSATSKTFPGLTTIQSAIDEVGLPDSPLWFLLIVTVVGIMGGIATRGSRMPMIGGILIMLGIVAGGAFGLFPWYYAVFGVVLVIGVNVSGPILGARS